MQVELSSLDSITLMLLPFTLVIFMCGYWFGKIRTMKLVRIKSKINGNGTNSKTSEGTNA